SLMLWVDAHEARAGGTRLQRLQTPLLLLLELAALVLLVGAAADPHVRTTQGTRPLVVVLDDSFSMLAGADSAPSHGHKALLDELRARPPYSVRFILAGERPQVLGEAVRSAGEADRLLAGWRCLAPASRLEEALALAGEVGGELALLLVVTDRAPPEGAVAD